ncbi:MAG: hypothetical protein M0D55_18885 [Elusimicrobiota bacterium]|nr:MAG: hypothetical protein M0D55_18885 [Elusimicrobiota bacterium]
MKTMQTPADKNDPRSTLIPPTSFIEANSWLAYLSRDLTTERPWSQIVAEITATTKHAATIFRPFAVTFDDSQIVPRRNETMTDQMPIQIRRLKKSISAGAFKMKKRPKNPYPAPWPAAYIAGEKRRPQRLSEASLSANWADYSSSPIRIELRAQLKSDRELRPLKNS